MSTRKGQHSQNTNNIMSQNSRKGKPKELLKKNMGWECWGGSVG